MTGVSTPSNGDENTSGPDELSPLETLYKRYIGEPERRRDVYIGFGLFFAGVALGMAGFFTFLYSGTQPNGSALFWQLREVALVAGLTGLPTFVLSIVVLLPVDRRALATSGVGMVLCLAAIGLLVSVYPYQWTTAETIDGSVQTIATYAAGLVVLSASTGAALVAEYLDRETAATAEVNTEAIDDEDSETVSDEEVAADIEEAMSGTELSWGGMEKQQNTERLSLDMPDIDPDQQSKLDETTATTTRAESDDVDSAVDGLRKLQGGEQDTARGSSTEEQVDALTKVRQQQASNDIETGVDEDSGLLSRLRGWLFG